MVGMVGFQDGKTVIVADTSALIAGFSPTLSRWRVFIPPSVLDEAVGCRGEGSFKIEAARAGGRLSVKEPGGKFKAVVEKAVEELGEISRLSAVDIDVLSLAMDLRVSGLRPIVVSNDFAIQNVAERLDLRHASMGGKGISWLFGWRRFCPGCGLVYKSGLEVCSVCGTKLRTRVAWRRPVRERDFS